MALDLNYRESGSGKPLIILHGLFGSNINWATVAKRLSANHRVFSIDLPNHGDSPHTPTIEYDHFARQVLHFIESKELGKVTVLGHSMGGKTAMTLALRFPEVVERLIVVDIAPVKYFHDHMTLLSALKSVDMTVVKRRDEIERALTPGIEDPALRMFLMKNIKMVEGRPQWRINLAGIEKGIPNVLNFPGFVANEKFTGPSIFIGGSDSDYIRQNHYSSIFKFFTETNIVMIKNAGHWIHAQQPERFMKTVEAFLEQYP